MPTYDYRCLADGQTYTVRHRMSEKASTWGELCALGALEPGNIAADTPVERILTTGGVVNAHSLKSLSATPCGNGGCGSGGGCPFQ